MLGARQPKQPLFPAGPPAAGGGPTHEGVRQSASPLPQLSLGPASPHQLDHGCLTLLSSCSAEGLSLIPPASASLAVSAPPPPAPHAGTGIPQGPGLQQLCRELDARLPLAGEWQWCDGCRCLFMAILPHQSTLGHASPYGS